MVRIDRPHGKETPELPRKSVNYHRELAEKGWRKGLKPLTVQQPEGPSFTVGLICCTVCGVLCFPSVRKQGCMRPSRRKHFAPAGYVLQLRHTCGESLDRHPTQAQQAALSPRLPVSLFNDDRCAA